MDSVSVQNVCAHFSCVQLFLTLGTAARQAPLSMGFSRQEYCSGLPVPSPGDLPHTGIKLASPVLAGRSFTARATWKAQNSDFELRNYILSKRRFHKEKQLMEKK